MNFRRGLRRDEPEINLIPLIDLLLVILIFLMVTTTYSRFTELKVNLPTAGADRPADRPRQIVVGVSADGRYQVDGIATPFASPAAFSRILEQASRGAEPIPLLVIEADAAAPHQAVVNVMEAARLAGLAKVTFAAQGGGASR